MEAIISKTRSLTMAKQKKVSYYPQPRPGKGFRFKSPRTGKTIECAGIEWYINFRDDDGKRRRHKAHEDLCRCPMRLGTCTHEQAARDLVANFGTHRRWTPSPAGEPGGQGVDVDAGGHAASPSATPPAPASPSIEEKVQEFIAYIASSRRHSASYLKSIRGSLNHFAAWTKDHGITLVSEVTIQTAREYSQFVQTENIAAPGKEVKLRKNNTVNRFLREVRTLYYILVDDGIVRDNPFRERRSSRKLFLPLTDEKPITIFTDDELNLLLSLTVDDIRPAVKSYAEAISDMIPIFYQTGMRLGEICNLTFAQLRAQKIYIEPHHDWVPKWGIRRSIPMRESLQDILKRREKDQPGQEYVFTSSNGTPVDEKNVYHRFVLLFEHFKIVGDTGLGVSPHSFRRTFCTHCLSSGVSATIVKDWMGHSKIEMTMKYYAKIPSKTDLFINEVNFISGGDASSQPPPCIRDGR